jgi:uncharacterized protein (TIGR03435 family)
VRPLLLLITATAFAASAQTFEAASIKRSDPLNPESSWNSSPGMVRLRGMSLKSLVVAAYDVKPYQVLGGPKWVDADRYDVVAKIETEGAAPARGKEGRDRTRVALQKLLAERFQLTVHEETRQASGYSLVVAKSGPRIKPVEGAKGNSMSQGPTLFAVKGASMDFVASGLASVLSMPVVNSTGLGGVYDFRIEFAPEGVPDSAASEKPSIFTVVQEALGLRLEAQKVPIKIVVVDRAEKPEEN